MTWTLKYMCIALEGLPQLDTCSFNTLQYKEKGE